MYKFLITFSDGTTALDRETSMLESTESNVEALVYNYNHFICPEKEVSMVSVLKLPERTITSKYRVIYNIQIEKISKEK